MIPCPSCKTQLNAVHGNRTPYTGDLVVCMQCRALLVFTDRGFGVRIAQPEDMKTLSPETLTAIQNIAETPIVVPPPKGTN